MLYEKITQDIYNIRIQEQDICYVYGYDGLFKFEEDVFTQGTLVGVDAVSMLVGKDTIEVASIEQGVFKIVGNYNPNLFNELDKSLRGVAGLKYRLMRNISYGYTQYLYIYNYGILKM